MESEALITLYSFYGKSISWITVLLYMLLHLWKYKEFNYFAIISVTNDNCTGHNYQLDLISPLPQISQAYYTHMYPVQ